MLYSRKTLAETARKETCKCIATETTVKTIAFINTKGGVGKTTLASNLAAWVALREPEPNRVSMLDLDPLRSLAKWWKRRADALPEERESETRNPDIFTSADTAAEAKEKLLMFGWDYLFIDSPPSAILLIKEAVAEADMIVIPVKPGGHDLDAMTDALRLAYHSGKPYLIVINEVMSGEKAQRELRATLEKGGFAGHVATTEISRRTAFRDGAAHGLAGFEGRDREAGVMLKSLWDEITTAMKRGGQ